MRRLTVIANKAGVTAASRLDALLAQKEWKKLRRDLFRAFFGKKMAPAKRFAADIVRPATPDLVGVDL
jgi:hypothetical protein